MSNGKPKKAKAKAAKAKTPTITELEKEELYRRSNLEATAEEVYAYGLDLPDTDASEAAADAGIDEAEDAAQHGVNLTCDAEDWVKAYRALREAKAKAA